MGGPGAHASKWRVFGGARSVIAVALALLLLAVGAGLLLHLPLGNSSAGPPASQPTVVVDPAARDGALRMEYTRSANRTLATMGRAILAHDRRAYLAAFEPGATKVRAAEARLFDNLRAVPFKTWNYSVSSVAIPRSGSAAHSPVRARVNLSYRLTSDPALTRRAFDMTFVRLSAQKWAVRNVVRSADTPPDPWNYGRVNVVSSQRALVMGTASVASMREYSRMARVGAQKIDRIWGTRWPRRSVVVVPSSQQQLAEMLGQSDQRGLTQIAAVTTGIAVDSAGSTAGQTARVIVNPQAMSKLGPLGHQVIITHEMTHLATRYTTTATPPTWLAEGFADYVAYSGTGLDAKTIVANAVPRSRVKNLTGLPSDEDFNPRSTKVDAAYAQSWLAVNLIAKKWSRAALLAFYRANALPATSEPDASAQAREGDAFAAVLGTTPSDFVREWRTYVEAALA